jgi:DNA-directed RNA polymerase subunit beta'
LYIVVDPGDVAELKEKDLLTMNDTVNLTQEYPGQFVAKMGAEAIKELLMKINIAELVEDLRGKCARKLRSKRN